MNIVDEIWKPVKGYEGLYEVSNLGRVKSISYSHGRKKPRNNIKKLQVTNRDYLAVCLYRNNKNDRRLVHILVAEAFLPDCPGPREQYHIDHINNDPQDNRACNLQWLTVRENVYLKPKANGHKFHGEGNPAAKLTEEDVIKIRQDSRALGALAKEYNVSKTTICDIRKGRIWKHLLAE